MRKKTITRDIEKRYSKIAFVKKLRRLAHAIESGKQFSIQIAGQKLYVPKHAIINIEHEKSTEQEEIEF